MIFFQQPIVPANFPSNIRAKTGTLVVIMEHLTTGVLLLLMQRHWHTLPGHVVQQRNVLQVYIGQIHCLHSFGPENVSTETQL